MIFNKLWIFYASSKLAKNKGQDYSKSCLTQKFSSTLNYKTADNEFSTHDSSDSLLSFWLKKMCTQSYMYQTQNQINIQNQIDSLEISIN